MKHIDVAHLWLKMTSHRTRRLPSSYLFFFFFCKTDTHTEARQAVAVSRTIVNAKVEGHSETLREEAEKKSKCKWIQKHD